MQADSIQVRVISDGTFLLDGGSVFGQVPRVIWEKEAKPDRKNRVRLGLNALLVQTPEHNILIDTGMGSKDPEITREVYGLSRSKLLRDLKLEGPDVKQAATQPGDHSTKDTYSDYIFEKIVYFLVLKIIHSNNLWKYY